MVVSARDDSRGALAAVVGEGANRHEVARRARRLIFRRAPE